VFVISVFRGVEVTDLGFARQVFVKEVKRRKSVITYGGGVTNLLIHCL